MFIKPNNFYINIYNILHIFFFSFCWLRNLFALSFWVDFATAFLPVTWWTYTFRISRCENADITRSDIK